MADGSPDHVKEASSERQRPCSDCARRSDVGGAAGRQGDDHTVGTRNTGMVVGDSDAATCAADSARGTSDSPCSPITSSGGPGRLPVVAQPCFCNSLAASESRCC